MGYSSGASLARRPLRASLILDLKFMRSGVRPASGGAAACGASVSRVVVLSGGRLRSRVYPVKRSELRTVSDGEFDWGGTSVKR